MIVGIPTPDDAKTAYEKGGGALDYIGDSGQGVIDYLGNLDTELSNAGENIYVQKVGEFALNLIPFVGPLLSAGAQAYDKNLNDQLEDRERWKRQYAADRLFEARQAARAAEEAQFVENVKNAIGNAPPDATTTTAKPLLLVGVALGVGAMLWFS